MRSAPTLPSRLCVATVEVRFLMPTSPPEVLAFELQTHDTQPGYPAIKRFLDDCNESVEGKLLTVRIVRSVPLKQPNRFRSVLGRLNIFSCDQSEYWH